jgi:hypothetical protein
VHSLTVTITNIHRYSVHYNANLAANSQLGGKTYKLNGGGYLTSQ